MTRCSNQTLIFIHNLILNLIFSLCGLWEDRWFWYNWIFTFYSLHFLTSAGSNWCILLIFINVDRDRKSLRANDAIGSDVKNEERNFYSCWIFMSYQFKETNTNLCTSLSFLILSTIQRRCLIVLSWFLFIFFGLGIFLNWISCMINVQYSVAIIVQNTASAKKWDLFS